MSERGARCAISGCSPLDGNGTGLLKGCEDLFQPSTARDTIIVSKSNVLAASGSRPGIPGGSWSTVSQIKNCKTPVTVLHLANHCVSPIRGAITRHDDLKVSTAKSLPP